VEIGQVIDAVAQVTGKTIIPDPRVRANVTMLSQTPMTPDAFYEAFLALLSVHNFVAVESGGIIKILPDANARQMPNIDLPEHMRGSSDELITQVIAVQNVNAGAARAGTAPAHAAVGTSRRLSGWKHPHHFRSRR
jgi:general secretion pathway protein D